MAAKNRHDNLTTNKEQLNRQPAKKILRLASVPASSTKHIANDLRPSRDLGMSATGHKMRRTQCEQIQTLYPLEQCFDLERHVEGHIIRKFSPDTNDLDLTGGDDHADKT